MNALNLELMQDVNAALSAFDQDSSIGAIMLKGSDQVFATGADIKEMRVRTYAELYDTGWFGTCYAFGRVRTPIIAAVAGYVLGGGCELAMMCDIIFAAETTKLRQPEIKFGVILGIGVSQRLTRAVDKAKAMAMCLTGTMMDTNEAERAGLVSRVVSADLLMDQALSTAVAIAAMPLTIARMTKEAINRAPETTLSEGVRFECKMFHSTFALRDQEEGVAAFVEKRSPSFSNE